jgi:hypothetical protein
VGVGVSAVAIDTEQSARAAATWSAWGDHVSRAHVDVDRTLRWFQVDAGEATDALASSAVELWTAAALLDQVIMRAVYADTASFPLDADRVAQLVTEARALVAQMATRCGWSPAAGELGDTGCRELRTPYAVQAADDTDLGRALVIRALTDTATGHRVRPDEFELVQLSDGRYLVVLPGVTDLSNPDPGLSDVNRTVRDLDQHAVRSWTSTSVADNRYAQMVWAGLVDAGVPPGSEVVIVGHSFGADTALDLAADPGFNGGPHGYRVSHVVAAGYDSVPQLADVPESTSVLVLQNHRDAAVLAEAAGRAAPIDAARRTAEIAWAASMSAIELVTGDRDAAGERLEGALTLTPGIEVDGRQVVAVFEGGGEGAGHHPDHYIEFLATSVDEPVLDFLADLAAGQRAGVGAAVAVTVGVAATVGAAVAVDISVPE